MKPLNLASTLERVATAYSIMAKALRYVSGEQELDEIEETDDHDEGAQPARAPERPKVRVERNVVAAFPEATLGPGEVAELNLHAQIQDAVIRRLVFPAHLSGDLVVDCVMLGKDFLDWNRGGAPIEVYRETYHAWKKPAQRLLTIKIRNVSSGPVKFSGAAIMDTYDPHFPPEGVSTCCGCDSR